MLFDGEQVGEKVIKGGKFLCVKDMPAWDAEAKMVKPNMVVRPTHFVDGGTGDIKEVTKDELDKDGKVKWMVSDYDFN